MLESPLLPAIGGYINGEWTPGDTGNTFAVHNPATGALLASVPAMAEAETERAIAAARGTLATPPSLSQRRKWLRDIAAALLDHRDELGRILTHEHGKPLAEARAEIDYAAGFFSYSANHVEALAPRELPEQSRGCAWTVHHSPMGVVGLITPWNFPAAMIAKKLSAAIAAGCPAVIRPSSKTPLSMIALCQLLHEVVELPAGRVNLVTGPPDPIGAVLCGHPDVRAISFTGSTDIGRALVRQCADGIKRLTLELGGNAPFLVFEDADLAAAADQLILNKFRGGGQTCVCANRILVQRKVAGSFAGLLQERVAGLRLGNGIEDSTDIGPLIDRRAHDKVRRHLDDALERGATLVTPSRPEPASGDWGCFFPPTIVRGVTPEMACWQEETFGPLVPLAEFDSEEEALTLANDTEFGLAGYFFTADSDRAERLTLGLECAHVGHNTGTGPTPEAPFGGMKHSGYGREGGPEGLHEFVEVRTVARRL